VGHTARLFLYANREENHEYRRSAPCASVVCSDQLWNLISVLTITARQFFVERRRIVEVAAKYRLPTIYFQKEFVDEGGLMSYGADYDELFRKAASTWTRS
jgi:hypothetical protein